MAQSTGDIGHTTGSNPSVAERLENFVSYIPDGSTIPDKQWRNRHRSVVLVTLLHIPFLFGLGIYTGSTPIAEAQIPATALPRVLLLCGVVFALSASSLITRFRRRIRTILSVTAVFVSSLALVQLSGGYIEAHFHFFVGMAMVAVYEDWVPFLWGLGYVVMTHGYFGTIDPGRVYNHTAAINNPWAWGFVHGGFVLMLCVALVNNWVSTERSREKSQARFEQAEQRASDIDDLQAKQAEIEKQRAEAKEARKEAEQKMQEAERQNTELQETASRFSEAMSAAADGDLTVRVNPDVADNEAMAQIAESFNKMMTETESAMGEIQTFSQEVASTSDQATAGANEATGASEDMSESIQGIASGASDQREMLETVSSEMTDLSATVEEVAASAETVAERSRETAEIADAGQETAQEAIAGSREVQTAIDSTVENVERLDEKMAEIGEIVELIGDIAEQTNMLALNANIEAARAGNGSGGDGFAVVADEVKQLAEETQTSASEIEQLIAETQAQTETTVTEARGAKEDMQESTESVEAVVEAFTQVAENAEATDNGIQEISDTTDAQAATTEETVSMVEQAVDISEATAAETETASATAQEQAASMSQVSASIESLAEQSERLQTMLSEFDVGSR